MKFEITRASCWNSQKPYEKAIPEIKTIEEKKLYGKSGVEITNTTQEVIWTIDINSVEELIKLSEETGKALVIGKSYKTNYYYVQIYDDYIE